MEILDIRTNKNEIYEPISKVENKILCKKINKFSYRFVEHLALGYYCYDIKKKDFRRIGNPKNKIFYATEYTREVEGEDSVYYITRTRQILENQYSLYKIDLDDEKEKLMLEFSLDNKYDTVKVEVLNSRYALIYAKKEEFDFEMVLTNSTKKYGYDIAYIFDLQKGNKYEVKDHNFLRGLRDIIFKTEINGISSIIYEENYLETWEKEDLYKRRRCNLKNERFYYKDSLKYTTVENFINEITNDSKNINFIEIATKGFSGYEAFLGADKDNIYYSVRDFAKNIYEEVIFFNKRTKEKTIIPLPAKVGNYQYSYSLENKYKGIFLNSLYEKHKKVKEIMEGKLEYTYDTQLGYMKNFIEDRYIITSNATRKYDEGTAVIDIDKEIINEYDGYSKVMDDMVILF